METLIGVTLSLPLMGGLGYVTAVLFRHDHSRGHCGWSGCQQPTTRSTS